MASGVRVTHVVLALDVGGLERGVLNQLREGRKLGQAVSLICLERPGALAAQVEALGASLYDVGKRPGLRPGVVLRLQRLLRELRPDVVHTHQLATLLYAGLAARLAGVPVVVHTEHGKEPYGSRLRTRLLGRLVTRWCDRFYCLSVDISRVLRAHHICPDVKLRVIRNGIDVRAFAPASGSRELRQALGLPDRAVILGTVGRLDEVKCQDLLIEGFAGLVQHFPDAYLVIVGDGPRLQYLRGVAERMGVEGRTRFVGYQPSSAPYLGLFDVFVLTSRSEGMPQVILEASVAGVPSVASRVGGVPEIIHDGRTGILFECGDKAGLISALCALLRDPERRRTIGGAARRRVTELFTVERMAAQYHRDYVDFLNRGPRERPVAGVINVATCREGGGCG